MNLMRNITQESIESNSFYYDLVKKGFNIDDLNKLDDLAIIPLVPASLFKESASKFKNLLKIPLKSPEFKMWNVIPHRLLSNPSTIT